MAVLLQTQLSQMPNQVALVDDGGTTTWAELDGRVNRLVNGFRDRGLQEGDTVVVMAGNQREAFEIGLACLHSGLVLVPVNWHWVAAELAHVVSDAGAAALVVGDQWTAVAVEADAMAPPARVRMAISLTPPPGYESYEAVLAAASPAEPPDQTRGGPMFYTSGTTGHPKGVRGGLTKIGGPTEDLAFLVAVIGEIIGVGGDDPVQLVCGPSYHSAQWVFSMIPLVGGAKVVLQHRFDAADVLHLIDEHQVTNVHMVPAQFVRLLRLPATVQDEFSGASLRQVHHGAAPCPTEIKRQMIEWWGPIITEYYGGTEGGFLTTITSSEWLERPLSVGRPLDIVEVLVFSTEGEAVEPGKVGDLYFRSLVGSDFSYHNSPAKTAAAHRENGVGTLGDVGHIDEAGYVFLSDRRIDMIISGGVNIYPAEIESALAGHPAVADVAVFGIPHEEMGEQVMAVLELVAGETPGDTIRAQLEAHTRHLLAGYKCPKVWNFVPELPRNDTGKLLKRVLREPYWEAAARPI